MYKYFLKAFYNKINKKEYNSQIWQYKVHHTNVIVIKDVIIEEKARENKGLSESIADSTASTEVIQALSAVDLARKYI